MTKEEEIKQAVLARNAKRKAKAKELAKRINEFLGNNLANAIAEDKLEIKLIIARDEVSEVVWDELKRYDSRDAKGSHQRNLIDLIVDDIYKPYLADYTMLTGAIARDRYRNTHITFILNQD